MKNEDEEKMSCSDKFWAVVLGLCALVGAITLITLVCGWLFNVSGSSTEQRPTYVERAAPIVITDLDQGMIEHRLDKLDGGVVKNWACMSKTLEYKMFEIIDSDNHHVLDTPAMIKTVGGETPAQQGYYKCTLLQN